MNTTARSLSSTILMGLFTFLSSCSYTAPFRRVESVPADAKVIVTLSAVEHQKGQRKPFFKDTQRVIADLPNQSGLVGYSFRFQIFGNKAWTMTAWKDEAARDRFAKSPIHLAAVRNSRTTAQNMRFVSVTVPASSLPMRWDEALRLLENAPPYE
jgi:heme-degrading monooxygenase HmoA